VKKKISFFFFTEKNKKEKKKCWQANGSGSGRQWLKVI
jgi:hypothetical protein